MNLVRVQKLLLICFISSQAVFAQEAQKIGFELSNGKKSIDIPFKTYNNLIVIELVLNKVIPLKFIVDTGVKTSILSDRIYLDILNTNYDRKINIVGAAGGDGVEAFVANNVKLELPGLICHGMPIFVLTEDYLRLGSSIGVPIQGILGSELFNRFVVKIDYNRLVITLYEPANFKGPRKYSAIPLELIDNKPYIKLQINQFDGSKINGKVLIDTGASHPIMLHQLADSSILLPEKKSYSLLGRGLGGDIYGFIARIDSLKIFNFSFSNVITSFPEEASYIDIIKETGRHGTIGGGTINRLVPIFDYQNKTLYLKKSVGYKKPFEADMSGMEIVATGFDFKIFYIAEVEPNTPASEAGILPGDVILKINHIPSNDLTLSRVNSLLHSKPGKKITIKVMRNKEIIKTKIVLRRLI